MSIKEIVAQVRAKLGSEELEKVSDLLSSITRKETELMEDLSSANHESKNRKDKIRELTREIDNKVDSKEDFDEKLAKKDAEIDRLKLVEKDYKTHKESENKKELAKWEEHKKVLSIDDADPEFDKVQKVIHKFNMEDEITPEQVKANNNLFETYEEVDYFAKTDNNYPDGGKPGGPKPSKLNPFDLKDGVAGAFRDMVEAIRISKEDPAKAKQLRESAGVFKE